MAFEYIGSLLEEAVRTTQTVEVRGRVEQVVGTIIRAVVPGVKVGELCILKNPWEQFELKAEVVGFIKNVALLSPLGSCQGVSPATEVIPTGEILSIPVGPELLGRVLDGLAQPLDGGPVLKCRTHYPIYAPAGRPWRSWDRRAAANRRSSRASSKAVRRTSAFWRSSASAAAKFASSSKRTSVPKASRSRFWSFRPRTARQWSA